MHTESTEKEWSRVGRAGAFLHQIKVLRHQAMRVYEDRGAKLRWPQTGATEKSFVASSVTTPLWSEVPAEEWKLEAGKVENLRVAARQLAGIEVPAGETFSFWAHLGRPTRMKGYVEGREVRAGCVIPTVAGGICLLSNALHKAALEAGFEILERHGHSHEVFQQGAVGTDATVFWNYVDLRFRSTRSWRLEVELDQNDLHVRILEDRVRMRSTVPVIDSGHQRDLSELRSCLSCVVSDCSNHRVPQALTGRRAFLLDARWPEFDGWLQENLRSDDLVLLPVDGARRGVDRYAWTLDEVEVLEIPLTFVARSLTSRVFRTQGPEMRRVQMRMDEILAMNMGRMLPINVHELVVSQHLLPHLDAHGFLGGRRVGVLATRPTLSHIQKRLDDAAQRWSDRASLCDFRASDSLVLGEEKALEKVDYIVTPNKFTAASSSVPAELVPWSLSQGAQALFPKREGKARLHFPGSTIARLGVCAVREALISLDIELSLGGPNLEEEGFWEGVDVVDSASLEECDAVVFTPWVSHNPRPLLRAIELGLPVITTPVMGLSELPGVCEVPCGDSAALIRVIEHLLHIRPQSSRLSQKM